MNAITRSAIIVPVGLALLFAGCGGDDDDSKTPATPPASSVDSTVAATGEPNGAQPGETVPADTDTAAAPAAAASTLPVAADPSGQLSYTETSLSTDAGEVEVAFTNASQVPHDVAFEQSGKVVGKTKVVTAGKDRTELDLSPGTYTFFCTVPGHEEAGMKGTLTVR